MSISWDAPHLKAAFARKRKNPEQQLFDAIQEIVSDEHWPMIPEHIRRMAFCPMEEFRLQN